MMLDLLKSKDIGYTHTHTHTHTLKQSTEQTRYHNTSGPACYSEKRQSHSVSQERREGVEL